MELLKPCEAAFGITTKAKIKISSQNTALLSRDGQELKVSIHNPKDAAFSVESCEQAAPQKRNKDARRLMIRYPAPKGAFSFVVLFKPCPKKGN